MYRPIYIYIYRVTSFLTEPKCSYVANWVKMWPRFERTNKGILWRSGKSLFSTKTSHSWYLNSISVSSNNILFCQLYWKIWERSLPMRHIHVSVSGYRASSCCYELPCLIDVIYSYIQKAKKLTKTTFQLRKIALKSGYMETTKFRR